MCHTIISRRKVDGRKFTPSRAFCRGAGFGGHRQALEHEARVLERAAADKHAHAARLRDKLQKRTEATTVSKDKSAALLGVQIKSTQAMLKTNEDEAAFYDRQVLTARRFIDTTPSQEEPPPRLPSPPDSLHKDLAEVSQGSSQVSPLSEVVYQSTAPAQQPRTGGAASSRLDHAHDSSESGPDSAHSHPVQERQHGEGPSTPGTSPDRKESDSLVSVSPLTTPASSQGTVGREGSHESQPASLPSNSASPKARPKQRPASQRQPVATARTTTTTTRTTRTVNPRRRAKS